MTQAGMKAMMLQGHWTQAFLCQGPINQNSLESPPRPAVLGMLLCLFSTSLSNNRSLIFFFKAAKYISLKKKKNN